MLRRLLPMPLVVLLLAGCGGGGSLSKKELQKQIESVQSFAAEGSLVAQGAAQSRSTSIFVRVHTQYLQKAANKVEQQLRSAHAAGELERKRAEGLELAATVSGDLGRLHESPGDRKLARRLQTEFTKTADEAERLAK